MINKKINKNEVEKLKTCENSVRLPMAPTGCASVVAVGKQPSVCLDSLNWRPRLNDDR